MDEATDRAAFADRLRSATPDDLAASSGTPEAFANLWPLIAHADPLVRLRAVGVAERASRQRAELLQPHKQDLLDGRLEDGSPELTWHLLPMAVRLALTADEAARLMRRLEDAVLNHPSHLVQAEALGAAFDLANAHRRLQPRARSLAKDAMAGPSRALAARACELLGC